MPAHSLQLYAGPLIVLSRRRAGAGAQAPRRNAGAQGLAAAQTGGGGGGAPLHVAAALAAARGLVQDARLQGPQVRWETGMPLYGFDRHGLWETNPI
jgi:hypothetical protein